MKQLTTGLLAITFSMAMASPSSAGFVETRAQWNALDRGDRLYYVSGVFDGLTTYWEGEPYCESRSKGWRACLQANDLTNGDLVEMIELGYRDVADWGDSPLVILVTQLNRLCYRYENVERERLSIAPIPRPDQD